MADVEEKLNGNGDVKPDGVEPKSKADVESTETVKQEPTSETKGEISDLEMKIIRQMEYYFGDINLSRDKFLLEQIKLEDGWVPMETMLKFNRLKSLSTDNKVICTALRKSSSSLLEISEDNEKVRRNPDKPLPENTTERKAELKSRSIFAKGIPLSATLDEIEEFFKQFGPVENIQMRKDIKKKFKGSVFVIYEKPEDSDKFVQSEDLKYGETVLSKSTKEDYFKRKDEERQQLKLKKEEERKVSKADEDKAIEDDTLEKRMAKGAIIHLTGFTDDGDIDDIKNYFNDFSLVQWVDVENKQAWVRFTEADTAVNVLEKIKEAKEGKIEINGVVLEGSVLDGEAEREHWKKIIKAQAESWNKKNKGRKRGHHFKHKGHRHFKREKTDGEPPAKAVKTE